MSRWSDQVRDEYGRPVPGVSIYVYKWDALAQVAGDLETLTDDSAAPISNPVISDDDGIYYFNSLDGQKLLELHYGGKVQERELILVGALPVPQATIGGLFINAAALTIPVGMDMVTTTGYSSLDVGAAVYVADAVVNAAYVTANPRTSFISLNERGFRLSAEQDIAPRMLGAGGVTDDAAGFTATVSLARAQSGSQEVGVVPVPAGTVYKIDNSVGDVQNVGFLQVAPRYQGSTQPGWAGDGTLYGNATKPANVWLALEGRMDRGSATEDDTQAGLFVSVHGDTSNSDVSFIKMAGYFRYRQNDPSDYVASPNINRDGVALGAFGVLAAGNTTGRVWAGYLDVRVEATGDGVATGLEIDCYNASSTQNTLDTTTSKYGLRVVASSGHFTAAMKIDSATGSDDFRYGLAINPTALSTGGAAIYMNNLFAVMKTGAVGIGTSTPEANVTLHLVSAASTKLLIESDGANESLATFRDTGTSAWSVGLNNSSAEYRIANGEALGSAIALAFSNTTLDAAFGGHVNVASGKVYKVNGTQVVGARDTGWAADTGTAKKTATATYAVGSALTVGAAYVQAEVTAIITRQALVEAALRDATQEIKALKDLILTHGLGGA